MEAVSLYREAWVSMRLPLLYEIRAKTLQRCPASPPVLMRYKLREIERPEKEVSR